MEPYCLVRPDIGSTWIGYAPPGTRSMEFVATHTPADLSKVRPSETGSCIDRQDGRLPSSVGRTVAGRLP